MVLGHGKDGHFGYFDTSVNVFKRVHDGYSLELRPEVKPLALGLSETIVALLVGCGARTLAPLDTLEGRCGLCRMRQSMVESLYLSASPTA